MVLALIHGPGEADARRKIGHIADVGLVLVAQAEAQREVGPQAPIVGHEDAHVEAIDIRQRNTAVDGEQAGPAAQGLHLERRVPQLLKDQGTAVALERGLGRDHEIAVGADDRLIIGVELRRRAADK